MIEQVTSVARSKSSAGEITGLTDGSPQSRDGAMETLEIL
jgi:hypothetical protein